MSASQFSIANVISALAGKDNGQSSGNANIGLLGRTESGASSSPLGQFSSLLDVVANINNESSKDYGTKEPKPVIVKNNVNYDDKNADNRQQDIRNSRLETRNTKNTNNDNAKPNSLSSEKRQTNDSVKNNYYNKEQDSRYSEIKSEAATGDKNTVSSKQDSGNGEEVVAAVKQSLLSEDYDNDGQLIKFGDNLVSVKEFIAAIKQLFADNDDSDIDLNAVFAELAANKIIDIPNANFIPTQDEQPTKVNISDLLSGLQDSLKQLRDLLATAAGQNTPFTDEQNNLLAGINSKLKEDISLIRGLLTEAKQAGKGDDFLSYIKSILALPSSDNNQNKTVDQIDNIKNLLTDDIHLINDKIQELVKKDKVINREINLFSVESISGDKYSDLIKPDESRFASRSNSPKVESAIFTNASAILSAEYNTNQNQQINNISNIVNSVNTAADTSSGGNSGNNSGQSGSSFGSPQGFGSSNISSAKSAQASGNTQFSNILSKADSSPISEQVVFHVKKIIATGNSKITIQLSPEDLGKLDIKLDIDAKGKTGVTITADNKNTLDMLQRDSQGLQKALTDAGLKADSGSLNFNLKGGGQNGGGSGYNQAHAAGNYQKTHRDEQLTEDELNVIAASALSRRYSVDIPDGLDIKI
ncbi:MAG: flagellar hook-length control protein FliK [Rickettsiales bacterium]